MTDEVELFNQQEFLTDYWQKKQLLIRSYLPHFKDPVDPEEIAGLACEEMIESRLVRQQEANWSLQHGPFSEAEIMELPNRDWTLLIQAVDQWLEPVANLKRQFSFLPDWRMEDVMVSFATDGGGVGPHFDNYDVFLLQGAGSRRWQIGPCCNQETPLRADSELRLLVDFHSEEEFCLNPGDVLYIPPRISHYGISTGNSLCYSIGFRAPSYGEMLMGFTDQIINDLLAEKRFVSHELKPNGHPGEIDPDMLVETLAELVQITNNPEQFLLWFGCHTTEPKYPELIESLEGALLPDDILRKLKTHCLLVKSPSSRFAYMTRPSVLHLFVDGRHFPLSGNALEAVQLLCERNKFESSEADFLINIKEIRVLLAALLNQGSLILR